jgi:hypothetical protein
MSIQKQQNLTPFASGLGFCQDCDGREMAVAVVKATYRFDARGRIEPAPPDEQLPVFLADQHHGDPATTSVRYASDIVPTKRGTDVAVVGHAYSRGERRVEVGFGIGAIRKLLSVCGPRVWLTGVTGGITRPVAFEKMPVRYELAFGGVYRDPKSGVSAHPENPVGVGFGKHLGDEAPLPSVEYRDSRFKRPGKDRRPAGMGFIPPGWRQRARFAGTFDARWEKTRRPLLPEDLDERFYNAVPEDQVLDPKLAGGERLALLRLHPQAEMVPLDLPRLAFLATFRVRDAQHPLPMVADTLLVEPDAGRFAISYRASFPIGDDGLRLRCVEFRALSDAHEPQAAACSR